MGVRRGCIRPIVIVVLVLAAVCLAGAAQDCRQFAGTLHLAATTLDQAAVVPAGTFAPPESATVQVPAFCRVRGEMQPAPDSRIHFEVWLPMTGWNGKLRGVGNGGYAGSIDYESLAWSVRNGYAAAATDTGHTGIGTEAGWAFEHPQKVIDFGYRAIHLTAVTGKAIVNAFYAERAKRAYFVSCSNGGRQALMEAQRFPEDYDGIIAGAPANYWTHLLANAAWNNQHLEDGGYIPPRKLRRIQQAALAQCDALDGVKDGLIQDPARCHVDLTALRCMGAESDECLTPAQTDMLAILYNGTHWPGGAQLFPGYAAGTEAQTGGWSAWVTGNAPGESLMHAFGTQFYKYMVTGNTSWTSADFDLARDTKAADEKQSETLNATNADMSAFAARGGKLILYHGWGDAAISPFNSINYYRRVEQTMGSGKARDFVRLFMVPGLQHCYGGAAPNSFGQDGLSTADPDNNINELIERWVEQGKAPDKILAVKRVKDWQPTSAIVRSRPVCAYPAVAAYKGTGSVDEAQNFSCASAVGSNVPK